MQLLKLKPSILILLLVVTFGAAAEEGGEGGEAKPAAPSVPKDQREFTEKTSKLNSLTTRIEEAERHFQELVRAKAEEKNTAEKQRIINQMLETTKDRNKAADEYMKVKADLELRYPNQGEHLDRRYQTQTKKSVEELEGAAGLDELLTRTKKIVEKKYATFEDTAEDKKTAPVTPHAESEDDKTKKLRLEK